jgi:mono/diheme cytochrome c family protein
MLIALLVTACRSARRGEAIGRPVPTPSPEAQRGQLVFQQHCHRCHPGGEGGLGPSLNDKPAPKFLMKTQVRAGLGSMPGFDKDKISAEELNDLMSYMLALRKAP